MSDLDFFKFKEFAADVSMESNVLASGGWEITIKQGDQSVVLGSQQMDRINKKLQGYILANPSVIDQVNRLLDSDK